MHLIDRRYTYYINQYKKNRVENAIICSFMLDMTKKSDEIKNTLLHITL